MSLTLGTLFSWDSCGSPTFGPCTGSISRGRQEIGQLFLLASSLKKLGVVFPWVFVLLVNVNLPAHCSSACEQA